MWLGRGQGHARLKVRFFHVNNPTFISQPVMQSNPFGENMVEVFMIQAS